MYFLYESMDPSGKFNKCSFDGTKAQGLRIKAHADALQTELTVRG